jgi:hypothetical protein
MTAVLVWIARVLVILMIIRLVVRFWSARRLATAQRTKPLQRAGGTLVRDPQCGTYVPESRALTVRARSGTLHFCSAACRDAWTAAHMELRT